MLRTAATALSLAGLTIAYSATSPTWYPKVVAPLARFLDPEVAHRLGIVAAQYGFVPRQDAPEDPILKVKALGMQFANPVGLAAGFDKNAEAIPGMLWAGFGFVEVGSVTPEPQPGSPKPRVFRLPADLAVINRYGFNSDGIAQVEVRLQQYRAGSPKYWPYGYPKGLVGINLGKNKDAVAISDYLTGVNRLGKYADYLVVNVSSPNTPNLRALQQRTELLQLMQAVVAERDRLAAANVMGRVPVLIKIAPDLSAQELKDIAAVALEAKVDGVIISNTTVARPASLLSPEAKEAGGLSGKPLFDPSTKVLKEMYQLTNGKLTLVGVGGISSGKDAYEKIKSGASLVQLYTAMVYDGPGVVQDIKKELAELVKADGYRSVQGAIGAYHRKA